jgi:hypothetical protein
MTMPWVKLDDQFWLSDKVEAAGLEAIGLHALVLSYCGQKLNDGKFTARDLTRVTDRDWEHLADQLVNVGLWDTTPNGWAIHDFLEYNPTAEQVKEDRRKARERQARWRERNGVTNAVTNGVTNAAPTRPDPTQKPPYPPTRGGRRRSVEPDPTHAPVPDFAGHNLPAQPAPPPPTLRAVP